MKIQYLGHACFKVTAQGHEIILDPYTKGSVPGLYDLQEMADLCLCSHGHGDHHGVDCITVRDGEKNGPFTITKVESWHDDKNGTLRGSNIIHILEADGVKAVHMGDIGCMPAEEQLQLMKDADVLMIPVGGHYTADPEVILEMIQKISPKICVPMHYRSEKSGFDVIQTCENFLELAAQKAGLQAEYAQTDSLTVKNKAQGAADGSSCPGVTGNTRILVLRQKQWNKKQVFNPYLPAYEYIPDGEPHVFGDRVYVYGSHDRFDGNLFCMNDYICYSADVHDLKEWRYEGVIYRKDQDPRNPEGEHCLWAPDVVKGLDGRYYLYYCFDYLPQVGVAVCDTPAGEYEYLGLVHYADGTPLGEREGDYIQFDPGVFIDDDRTVYLYSGNAPTRVSHRDAHKNSQVMTLEEDMVTLKTEPRELIPTVDTSEGTGFEWHEFFEASSIRKVNGLYYFVYSSVESHELCYCVSEKPDRDYRYGGTIVSIGDIFLDGRERKDSLNFLGNTHGGIELINGEWYIFYHRQTNKTQFSRQGCAEKIQLLPDGTIPQVEITSCGLNGGPLEGKGTYEARIACNLMGKKGTVMSYPETQTAEYPFFTQDGADRAPDAGEPYPVQYIANMSDGSAAGYKYFVFDGAAELSVTVRSRDLAGAKGTVLVSNSLHGSECGQIPVTLSGSEGKGEWTTFTAPVSIPDGTAALYLEYQGEGSLDLLSFSIH